VFSGTRYRIKKWVIYYNYIENIIEIKSRADLRVKEVELSFGSIITNLS
jgi:hypothetical protein